MPLFFGVLQLALIWHVKTTLISAAAEGARYGAAYDKTSTDGASRTAAVIDETFGSRLSDRVSARETSIDGQAAVEVEVSADVPVLAFWGPTVSVDVRGHAIKEILP